MGQKVRVCITEILQRVIEAEIDEFENQKNCLINCNLLRHRQIVSELKCIIKLNYFHEKE